MEASISIAASTDESVVVVDMSGDEGLLLPIAFLIPYEGTVSPGFV